MNRRDLLKAAALLPALGTPLVKLGAGAGDPTPFAQPSRDSRNQHLPSFVILVFDAFSARHASLYGYSRATTPALEQLAERSTVFHAHYAGGNFTTTGTASLLTGAYPWSHRAMHQYGTVRDGFSDRSLFAALPDAYTSVVFTHNQLAVSLLQPFVPDVDEFKPTHDLSIADLRMVNRFLPKDFSQSLLGEQQVFHGRGSPPSGLLLPLFKAGLRSRAIHRFQDGHAFPRGLPGTLQHKFRLEDTVDWLVDHLAELPKPYCVYCHVLPPHGPYNTRADFVDAFDDGWSPASKPISPHALAPIPDDQLALDRRHYDEFVAYVDAELGRLDQSLRTASLLDDTYLMVTSDHGELFERGIKGHTTPGLYDPVIRIPLTVTAPGQVDRRDVHHPTSCTDVLPTILGLAGADIPSWCEGRPLSLDDAVLGRDEASERQVFAVEAAGNPKHGPLGKAVVAMMQGRYKLVNHRGLGGAALPYELYDLENDPEELEELSSAMPGLLAELRDGMDVALASAEEAALR